MTLRVFDNLDMRALRALADFEIDDDGKTATITGVEVEIVRLADDGGGRLRLQLKFSNDEKFIIFLSRSQTLKQLDIGDGES